MLPTSYNQGNLSIACICSSVKFLPFPTWKSPNFLELYKRSSMIQPLSGLIFILIPWTWPLEVSYTDNVYELSVLYTPKWPQPFTPFFLNYLVPIHLSRFSSCNISSRNGRQTMGATCMVHGGRGLLQSPNCKFKLGRGLPAGKKWQKIHCPPTHRYHRNVGNEWRRRLPTEIRIPGPCHVGFVVLTLMDLSWRYGSPLSDGSRRYGTHIQWNITHKKNEILSFVTTWMDLV